ncbi:MAG: class I SAM-dependent methyltransferase [Bacteroidales bacterium]|nr:class I SAM-dependent methyltransferase [Bacteroidales bacterium]MDT8432039.1 class I SAM-dependent methyltransferase [Bacteroidales bacterium]
MSESKKDFPLKDYYSKIYEKYDLVNRVFTFGQDVKWRRKAVRECLRNNPSTFLDICTGTGDLVIDIARSAGKEIALHGYDFSAEMLQKAREKAAGIESGKGSGESTGKGTGDIAGIESGNKGGHGAEEGAGIKFTEGDVANMPYADGTFDTAGITFGIRNLVYENSNANKHLGEIHRVLRDYGRLVILESSKPDNRIWRFFNNMYLQLILPWLGGFISGNFKAYRYLAKSSKNYYSKKEMSAILEKAGFLTVRTRGLFLGSVMLLVAEKQGTS